MGRLYADGKGVETDYQKALECYNIAKESGNVEAIYNIAALYYEGKGVAKDRKKAKQLMKEAAKKGSQSAQYFLDNNKF